MFKNRNTNIAERKIEKKKRKKEIKKKKEKYLLWQISRSLIKAGDKETSHLMFLYNEVLINQGSKSKLITVAGVPNELPLIAIKLCSFKSNVARSL